MHGRLEFDRRRSTVTVVGVANWFALLFGAVCVLFLLSGPGPRQIPALVFVIGVALLGGIFALQRRRFREAAEAAANLWSSPVRPS